MTAKEVAKRLGWTDEKIADSCPDEVEGIELPIPKCPDCKKCWAQQVELIEAKKGRNIWR